MAKTTKKQPQSVHKKPQNGEIIVNQITIAQLTRGNQDIQTWINNVKAAEKPRDPNRKPLLNTYQDISIDLHLKSCMDKRVRAVKTTPFEWPGLENDLIIENFKSPWFFDELSFVMQKPFYGHTLIEHVLGSSGLIEGVLLIPRQHVKPEKGIITLTATGDEMDAIRYREAPYLHYVLEVGRADDLGLLANIAPYVLMKRLNLADYSRFNEMYGHPLRWYEYDPLQPDSREMVKKSAEEMGSAGFVIVPKGTTVNFVEATKQATAYTFEKFHSIMNDEITIGTLGQLLTTGGEGGGSYALGNVHKAVEQAINLEDRLYTEYVLNYPFRNNILIPHGYPLQNIKGKFVVPDELPTEKKADMWVKLSDAGLPIAQEDFYSEFGVPMPKDGAPVIVNTKPTPEEPDPSDDDPKPDDKQPGGAAGKKRAKPENKPAPKKLSQADKSLIDNISTGLSTLYANQCGSSYKSMSLSYQGELQKIIDRIIEKIMAGDLKMGDVDPDLYKLVGDELFKAVERGYEMKIMKTKPGADLAMLKNLRENVYVFSGFKDYHFLREATDKLFDPTTGLKRSFSDFKADILKLNAKYNVDWLRTEYNHAIGSSRMASKWLDAQKNKDLYPYLEYVTAGDSRVRVSHRPLDGVTKHVDDPFWNTYYPPNDWNCRCLVKQVDEYNKETQDKTRNLPEIKDMFKMNSGKQGVIFPKSHPYYKVLEADKGKADNNFGLKLPE